MTRLAAALALGLLSSCAAHRSSELRDPLQGFNRKMFWFNDKVDVWMLEPVARGGTSCRQSIRGPGSRVPRRRLPGYS